MHITQTIRKKIIQQTNVHLPKGQGDAYWVYPNELPKAAHWDGMPFPSALPKEVRWHQPNQHADETA